MQQSLGAHDLRRTNTHDRAFDIAPVPMWIYEPGSLRVLAVNDEACRQYGYSRQAFLGMTLRDLRSAHDSSALEQALTGAAHTSDGRWRHITSSGELRFVEVRSVAIEHQGRPARLVVASNISEAVLAEERVRVALEACSDGIWDWNAANGDLWWSSRLIRRLGYAPDRIHHSLRWWLDRIHPDDAPEVKNLIQSAASDPTQDRWHAVYRFARGDGGWAEIEDRGVIERDPAGLPVRMIGGVLDIGDRRRAERELETLRTTDAETGLPNRAGALRWMSRRHADGRLAWVAVAEIDGLGALVAHFGDLLSRRLIHQLAARLPALAQPDVKMARLALNQFLMASGTDGPDITVCLEALADALRTASAEVGLVEAVGWRIGVCLRDPLASHEELLRRAEVALFRAKAPRSDGIEHYCPAHDEELCGRTGRLARIRDALDKDQFELHYQPIVSCADGSLKGLEALIRWRLPDGRLVPPNEFIGLSELSGLILPVGDWALERACRDIARLHRAGLDHIVVSVNVSAKQFLRGRIAQAAKRCVRAHGIPAHRLELELTESVFLADAEQAMTVIRELEAAGIGTCIDDFGTGYSSLSYLMNFPVQRIKIDRSFVAGIVDDDPRGKAVCRAILALAESFGMDVVAEGIEHSTQFDWLSNAGCQYAQGFLLGRPQPLDTLLASLAGTGHAAVAGC